MAKLTVLQLDTAFPRVPGDVAAPDSYICAVDIVTIPAATVAMVVTDKPEKTNISGFEAAIMMATSQATIGDVITTSCGFLCHWQNHFARLTHLPFIGSALMALPRLMTEFEPERLGILTFDATILRTPSYASALTDFGGPIIGLPPDSHLRQVINNNDTYLDNDMAEAEIMTLIGDQLAKTPLDALLLECTNLPPYKASLQAEFGLKIYDILSLVHETNPQMVKPDYL